MKENRNICPGCKKHCTMDCVRCKRGKAYFAKLQDDGKNRISASAEYKKKHHHKWERNVSEDGPVWRMLWLSKPLKKALRQGEISEAQLMESLNEAEREHFSTAMEKILSHFKKQMKGVSEKHR